MPYIPNSVISGGPPGSQGPTGPAGAGASATTLTNSPIIGATTVTVAAVDQDLALGAYIAIGSGTSSCEVRRITSISSLTLTLNAALKVAHTSGDDVWVTTDFWIPFEWWGARSANSAVDSYRNLINALMDQSVMAGGYGLTGRGVASYYSSRPLFIDDYCELRNAKFTAYSTFALDCTIGDWDGIPNQYFFMLAGQVGTATFDSSTDVVTFSVNPGSPTYSDVVFYPRPGSTMPTGIEEGRRYFTITGNSVTSQVTLSQDVATPVDFSSNGSGEIVFVSTGLARAMWDKLIFDGALTKGLNGVIANVQQPSITSSIRVENFPVMGISLGAQQGYFPNLMAFDCWTALELAGAAFCWFPGGNIEGSDINVDFAETERAFGQGANLNVVFGEGFHFESPGQGSSLVQTLVPSAALLSGTFQLRFKNELSAAIDFDATAAEIETILKNMAAIGASDVTCTQVTGTNLSDGPIRCDFTVGDLRWEFWEGSTNTVTGGQMAVANSSLTGGTLAVSYLNTIEGRNIAFKWGQAAVFAGCEYAGSAPIGGVTPPFIMCEGTAVDSSEGPHNGFTIRSLYASAQYSDFVDDSLNGINLAVADTTGAAQFLDNYTRPMRHGGAIGQHWWYVGDAGRQVKLNSRGLSLLELKAGSTQTDNLLEVWDTAGVLKWLVNENGQQRIGDDSGPLFVSGSGTPEGAVTAPVGSLYLNTAGGAGTTLYVKQSGAGNTGWIGK